MLWWSFCARHGIRTGAPTSLGRGLTERMTPSKQTSEGEGGDSKVDRLSGLSQVKAKVCSKAQGSERMCAVLSSLLESGRRWSWTSKQETDQECELWMPRGPLDTLKLAFFPLHFKDYMFKLCFLFQSTVSLLILWPLGSFWRESSLGTQSFTCSILPSSCGFAREGLQSLSQNRHDDEDWRPYFSPKSFKIKTFHRMLKKCQHSESPWWLRRVARRCMGSTVAAG